VANSTAYGTITYAVFAAVGIVLGAAYLLWLYQRVFWGSLDNPANAKLQDVNGRELGMMVALVILMVWIGVYPKPLFEFIEEPVNYIVQKVDPQYFEKHPLPAPQAPAPAEGHHEVAAK
jgi:NADH-quinone oxidoreductase subunit M